MYFGKIKIASILFLNILLAVPINIKCQSFAVNSSYHELVYVHLNKLIYVAGEQVRYRAFVVDPLATDHKSCSKILYFTLTSNKDKNQVSWRINLEDKPEMCYFTLPDNMKPGMYVLSAYTNLMRNIPDSYYSQNVLILSLSESTPDTIKVNSGRDSISELNNTSDNYNAGVSVKPSKAVYLVREKARIAIALDFDRTADISISVSLENPIGKSINRKNIIACFNQDSQGNIKNMNADNFKSMRFKYSREDHTFILSGRIRSRKDNSPLVSGKIFISVIDSMAPRIKYSKTDSAGNFIFYLDKLYDNKKVILQFADQNKFTEYYWELDSKTPDQTKLASSLYLLKPEEKAFLNEASKLRLIDAVYTSSNPKTNSEEITRGTNYFSPPTLVVIPAEYFDLVNFKEITDNILPLVKFGMKNGNYYVQILNEKTAIWKENSIVLLNGVPFTDLAYIATLGTKDIKRIEIIGPVFLIGDIIYTGLVSIYTYDNKIPDNYLKNNSVTFKNTVISNSMAVENEMNEMNEKNTQNYPDFRNCLFWKSSIVLKGHENLNLEFPVSGLTGKFIINVEGVNQDGHPVSAASSFEVKEK